jgi:3'-phosphoadenosine 5'-phosphosulfate sulfotransferase (PAPS reductase)/FAD synthetase
MQMNWQQKMAENVTPLATNRKHIVALSGGKDSTAMALALAEFEPADYTYVCTPTGDELPEMVEHWAKLENLLGKKIIHLGERTLAGLIVEQSALPNHRQRWCTRKLKLETYYRWLADQGPVISHVGLRADEESRPGMIFPDADGVAMDFPMRRWGWSLDDVHAFLDDKGVTIPGRTDCALCFWQRLGEWHALWRDHPDRFERGVALEAFVSEKRGKPYTFRSPSRDTWPASLRDLRNEFEKGRVPKTTATDARRQIGACRVCTL